MDEVGGSSPLSTTIWSLRDQYLNMVGMDKIFGLLVSPNMQFFVSHAYRGYFLLFSSKKKRNKYEVIRAFRELSFF